MAKSRTGSMAITISRARGHDRSDILNLIQITRIGTHLALPLCNYVVAKVNRRIVGCAGIEFHGPTVAVLTHVAVRENMRHRGIGAALIKNRIATAIESGANMMALVTMYYHFNLYKRRGFHTCSRKDLPNELKSYWMFTSPRYMKCAVMWRRL